MVIAVWFVLVYCYCCDCLAVWLLFWIVGWVDTLLVCLANSCWWLMLVVCVCMVCVFAGFLVGLGLFARCVSGCCLLAFWIFV